MKVQLFVPPQGYIAQRWEEGSSMPPLGILYLAAVLEQNGILVDVVPADILQYGWKNIRSRLQDFQADVVGCTTTTENRFDSFKLVQLAKKTLPGAATVLGGPHISMAGEETLEHVLSADFLVIGEGEFSLLELVQSLGSGKGYREISGISFRDNERVVNTGPRPPIEDLDQLPLPARHLVSMEKYNFVVESADGRRMKAQNLMTSRGCPFNCYFCATPVNWGRRVRGHSPERVIKEIEHVVENYGAEYIWFYDDTLNYNPERLHRILDLMLERDLKVKFCNEFRIDGLDKALLEKMVAAGLDLAFFGIEAGHPRVRKEVVHKHFDIEKALQFVRWAGEFGFIANAFFIFSHHTETWYEAQKTIEIMAELKLINSDVDITTAILHVYPGTPLEQIAKEIGLMPTDFSWSRKRDMRRVPTLPAAQGQVPLFKDRLSWFQVADLVMRWSAHKKKIVSASKIRQTLFSLKSGRDLLVAAVFFITMLKFKIKRIFTSE